MEEALDFGFGTENHTKGIYRLIKLTGWGETLDVVKRVIRNPSNRYIIVTTREESIIIAIALTVQYNNTGFIGHVIVDPEFRNMAIGKEIMKEAINYLVFKGCTTIKLDAVPLARTLYERVGFKEEHKSLRYKLDLQDKKALALYEQTIEKHTKIYPIFNAKEHDLAQIFERDKDVFGADRSNFLILLFEAFPEFCFIAKNSEGFLEGYLFGDYEENILRLKAGIANSKSIATSLIAAAITTVQQKNNCRAVKAGIIDNNSFGLKLYETLGFILSSYSLRMYYGESNNITVNPYIFAIGDPAKG